MIIFLLVVEIILKEPFLTVMHGDNAASIYF
jgi:hypothetical protein